MTDTNIWKTQRWFKKLSVEFKCAFMYIKDQCDHAGMWQIDVLSLCEDLGIESFDFAEFITQCNKDFDKITGLPIEKDRLLRVKNSTLWITGFILFQYQDKGFLVNPTIPAVKSALEILKGYGVYEQALAKGYFTLKEGLPNPTVRAKDKDKDIDIDIDKDKDKDELREGVVAKKSEKINLLATTYSFFTPEFESVWKDFIEMRRKKRKPLTDRAITLNLNVINRLSNGRGDLAIKICEQTIMRGWDGFFELKVNDSVKTPSSGTFVIGQKHNAAG